MDAIPTTAYTMTYTLGRCAANCAFCAQARTSQAPANRLSRVTWPAYPLSKVLTKLSQLGDNSPFQRLCFQTLVYPRLKEDLIHLIDSFHQIAPTLPLSAALPPLPQTFLYKLKELGLERVAIALDTVTPEIFRTIKGQEANGPFRWESHILALESALAVFGSGKTTTHFIIGLGETEEEAVKFMQEIIDRGVEVGLFPFTPIPGTPLAHWARPSLKSYRRIQLAHFVIKHRMARAEELTFDTHTREITSLGVSRDKLSAIIDDGRAFQTTGCSGCNRPFFTERPSEPLYNYPTSPPAEKLLEIRQQLGGVL